MRVEVAPVDFPYLLVDRSRHGQIRYYVRMPGKKMVRIRAEPGTEAFVDAYWAARKGVDAMSTTLARIQPGSFAHIANNYLASRDFKALDAKLTQQLRRRVLKKLVDQIGDKPAKIDVKTLRAAVKRRNYAAAKDFLTTLRAVYRVAVDDELVDADPTIGIPNPKPSTDGFHTWTLEDCARYEKRWPLGTQARTAYAIGLYTGQRGSDAVRLGRPMERDGRIHLRQWKNRAKKPVDIDIRILPPLREALDAWQGSGLTWLQTESGKPFSVDGFRGKFREWCDAAGLSHCSFHGLRKALATRLAEQGRTAHEIMAVLGHSTHQQAATYTAKAARAGLADRAFEGLFEPPIVAPVQEGATKQPKKMAQNKVGKTRWQSLGESGE